MLRVSNRADFFYFIFNISQTYLSNFNTIENFKLYRLYSATPYMDFRAKYNKVASLVLPSSRLIWSIAEIIFPIYRHCEALTYTNNIFQDHDIGEICVLKKVLRANAKQTWDKYFLCTSTILVESSRSERSLGSKLCVSRDGKLRHITDLFFLLFQVWAIQN